MNEAKDIIVKGSAFPDDLLLPLRTEVLECLKVYAITEAERIRLVDSSQGADDIRLNYIIDRKWVLRFCNPASMDEARLGSLKRLVERYNDFGIRCPRFIEGADGKLVHNFGELMFYLSEFIDLKTAAECELKDFCGLWREVYRAEARFAEAHRNVDLSETYGMYSLFDLSPFDIPDGIDEKQSNFNELIDLLNDEKEFALAEKLTKRHEEVRAKLKAIYKPLPRCVFQADENYTNVLVDDEQRFVGFIDFNLAGTEVIVNQLVNLTSGERSTESVGAKARLASEVGRFRADMEDMLKYYHASDLEKQAIVLYAWIEFIASWQELCFFRKALKGKLRDEIVEYMHLVAELPEEALYIGE